jgi:hypothetical protein
VPGFAFLLALLRSIKEAAYKNGSRVFLPIFTGKSTVSAENVLSRHEREFSDVKA